MIFGGLNPSKSCSHAGKTPDFEKSTFSALGVFLLDFGPLLRVNQGSEITKNRFWKVMKKQVEKGDVFFRPLEGPKWPRVSCPLPAPLVLGLEGRGKGRGGSPNKEKMRYRWEIIDEETI